MSGISTAPGPPVRRSGEYMASLPSDLAPPITTHNLGPTQISPHITHSTYTPASVAEVYPSQSSSYHTLPAATYTYTPPTTTNIATPPTQTIARNDTDLPPLIQHRPDVLREYDEIYDEEAHRRALEVETHEKELELERKKERERLVSGLDNDDLNALLRAFDKQVQNVHICPPPYDGHIPVGLDLHPSPEEEFSVDKVRSSLERFYSSVGVGMIRVGVEIQRIRNWEEGGQRTLIALGIYTYAWLCNQILTTLLLFLSMLVLLPKSRRWCFDAPLPSHRAHTSSSDPTEVNPDTAFQIAESKSKEESSWGPAASEKKASTWADTIQSGITSFTTPSSGGKQMGGFQKQISENAKEMMDKDMERKEEAGATGPEDEKSNRKDKAIELYAQPTMRIIGGIADKWERIANSLNPTPPFALKPRRFEVFAYLIAPLFGVTMFVSERMISRVLGIIIGFILFGQPLISHILEELDRIDPHWLTVILLEGNILSDVPTNSQLVLRLLRDAEHHRRPLPPPQILEAAQQGDDDDDDEEDDEPGQDDDEGQDEGEGEEVHSESRKAKMAHMVHKTTSKVKDGARSKARRAWDKVGRAKEEGFALVTGHKKVDFEGKAEHALEKMHISKDTKPAKALLEKLPSAPEKDSPDNPSRFYVHHEHHGPGHLIIYPPTVPSPYDQDYTPARVEFTTVRHVPASQNAPTLNPDESPPPKGHLTVWIDDIVALKKVEMNLPGRMVLDTVLNVDGAGGTGLEVKVVRRNVSDAVREVNGAPTVAEGKEEVIRLGGIVRRNELFDRLLALGEQRWEMY